MQFGLIISVLLHAAVLGWAVFTIHTQQQLRVPEPEPVAVDLITPSELTKLRQGVRTAKHMEAETKDAPKPEISKKESPKPTPVATPKPEPPPEPKKEEAKPEPKPEPPKEVAKAEPKPEPKPEPKVEPPKPDPIAEQLATDKPDPALEQAKLEEKIREEQRKAEEQKKLEDQKRLEEQKRIKEAEAKKKREEDARKKREADLKKKKEEEARKIAEAKKQKSFDEQMKDMQALLNKTPDKGAPVANNNTPETPTKNKGPVLGAKEGRDKQLSASEAQMLVAMLVGKIRECYRPPVGAAGGLEGLRVRISMDLKPDGTLAGPPRASRVDGQVVTQAAIDAAERAVLQCQPYDLPRDKYEFWRGADLVFNPKELFGQ